jgi:lipid-A-disaccharide synthase
VATGSPLDSPRVFVATGELSGDLHAGHAIRALQALRRERGLLEIEVEANGSRHLADAGAILLHDVATWSEIGFVRSFMKAPMFLRAMRRTVDRILERECDMVVLVDSRVMNLRIAKALRTRGYKGRIVYYVAPVRWESTYDPAEHAKSLQSKRFLETKQYCDLAIPIYPVSLRVYEELGIPHIFPGHPLCELAGPVLSDAQFAALTGIRLDARPPLLIGAMVGSRRGEIRDIAPRVFGALRLIQQAFAEPGLPDVAFVALVAHAGLRGDVLQAARKARLDDLVLLDAEHGYDLMARARLMVVKSGTGLHECMLMGVPSLMCYRVAPYLAWIARHLMHFKMPYYGFPNLLAGRLVVPELVQEECTSQRIAQTAGELLFSELRRLEMLSAFSELSSQVCRPEPLRTAALALQAQLDHRAVV